jgi:PAS domain S-box-containing protein
MSLSAFPSIRLVFKVSLGCALVAGLLVWALLEGLKFGGIGDVAVSAAGAFGQKGGLVAACSVMVWFSAMVCGVATRRFWERSIGRLAFSARRIAEGDRSAQFEEFQEVAEVRELSKELHTLVGVRERQSADLRETLRYFTGTFENSAVGIFHVNPAGCLERVNQHFCELVGRWREKLFHQPVRELVAEADRAEFEARLRALFSGGGELAFRMEIRCMLPEQQTVWLRVTVTLQRAETEGAEFAIGFAEDVSAQHRMEEKLLRSEASLRGLMDCNRDSCVAILDLSGGLISVSPSGLEILGVEPGSLSYGFWWGEIWKECGGGDFEKAILQARSGGVGHFQGRRHGRREKNGQEETVWWEVTITGVPGPDGQLERLLSVARDVTVQQLAAQTLQRAKESAEAASRAKDDFLSALSHELRTPLSPVLLLSGEYARSIEVSPRMREDFALIHRNVRLEARLIDDLLDLTRIQRGGLSMSARLLDLGALIGQMCETLRAETTEKRVRVLYDRPMGALYVRGDATRLHQIFMNLVLNAVKFSLEDGLVRICLKEQAGLVRVSVSDEGIGISPEEQDRIFDPFVQGSHSREPHRFGGLGLGLAIAKMLVERHRGRIWVESPGRGLGATFHVELLRVGQEMSDAVPVTGSGAGEVRGRRVRSRRILLVEDHEPTRMTLSRMLGRRGHEVTSVATLEAGMERAKERVFDVLISDIGLPDGNGAELIRDYGDRFLEGGIALSGFGMEAEVRRSLQAGFRKHLTKPIELDALEETLESWEVPQEREEAALSAV